VLCSFTTDQGYSGLGASVSDTGNNGSDPIRIHSATGDVVRQEKRLRTANDDVVNNHRDQVTSDCIVLIQSPCDGNLRSHPIRGCSQEWLLVVLRDRQVE
jgi:hypothetical protein